MPKNRLPKDWNENDPQNAGYFVWNYGMKPQPGKPSFQTQYKKLLKSKSAKPHEAFPLGGSVKKHAGLHPLRPVRKSDVILGLFAITSSIYCACSLISWTFFVLVPKILE